MTNNVQVFNFENSEIRTTVIDNQTWFVGKDVASVLGYANPAKAVIDHVDDEDKKMGSQNGNPSIKDNLGRKQNPTFINESGIYSMIWDASKQSRNPGMQAAAKQFKRWVTSELLPSIRKTGGYQVKQMTPMELLETQYEALKDVTADQKQLRNDFADLKEQFGLPNDFRKRFTKARNKRIVEIMGGYYGTAYANKKLRSAVYRELSNYVKDRFQIGEYANLPLSRFDEAMRLVENWQPSEVTSLAIDGANNQTVLDV